MRAELYLGRDCGGELHEGRGKITSLELVPTSPSTQREKPGKLRAIAKTQTMEDLVAPDSRRLFPFCL
ncbi:uncharacterized protein CCOS01_05875 [Colletotrichum costaricense]|uniref:Uncharacterized protein n=1 Tax=Colletotrichum costaricense TaxID=1209916 RepID=A0AAJ0E3C0_9PEZI|nr:uncharacterized protein CCOS01_05875 [Colletotrichum costaricense]KAK1530772.1 hypothetical protein CCOS01_05875 [Colletotrichum costaricense]